MKIVAVSVIAAPLVNVICGASMYRDEIRTFVPVAAVVIMDGSIFTASCDSLASRVCASSCSSTCWNIEMISALFVDVIVKYATLVESSMSNALVVSSMIWTVVACVLTFTMALSTSIMMRSFPAPSCRYH